MELHKPQKSWATIASTCIIHCTTLVTHALGVPVWDSKAMSDIQQSRDARSLPPIHTIDAPVDRQSELKVNSWRIGERVVHARVENASAPWVQTEKGGKPPLLTNTSWPGCSCVMSLLCVFHAASTVPNTIHPFCDSMLPFSFFLIAHSNTLAIDKHRGSYCSPLIYFKSEARLPRQMSDDRLHLYGLIVLASAKESIGYWLTREPRIKRLTECLNSPFDSTRWNETARFCKRFKGSTFLTLRKDKKAP